MNTPPEPSKRPFGFPLPASAWEFFTHWRHPENPFRDITEHEGRLYAISPFGIIRAHRFDFADAHDVTITNLTQPIEGQMRWDAIHAKPWEIFDELAERKEWRPLDDIRLALFRKGVLPTWKRSIKPGTWYTPNGVPLVGIGAQATMPLSFLQLASRLPRAEVYTATNFASDMRRGHILIRFNGGELIAKNHALHPDHPGNRVSRRFFLNTTRNPLPGRPR